MDAAIASDHLSDLREFPQGTVEADESQILLPECSFDLDELEASYKRINDQIDPLVLALVKAFYHEDAGDGSQGTDLA